MFIQFGGTFLKKKNNETGNSTLDVKVNIFYLRWRKEITRSLTFKKNNAKNMRTARKMIFYLIYCPVNLYDTFFPAFWDLYSDHLFI